MAATADASALMPWQAWRPRVIWIVAALAVVVALRFQTFVNLSNVWWGTTAFNHCALIPLISAYMIWLGRARFAVLRPETSWLGVAYVAANAALWFAGSLLAINVALHLAAVGFLIGTIWALVGNRTAYAFLFPLLYLYFMVPEGIFLVPYLQDWTATVLVSLLRATDIPVFLEGRYLQIPSGHFHVAKACSGINYLLATLAVGSMFAYINFVSYWRRAAFLVLAVAVPLVANGIRAYGIVMIAHLSDYRYAMGVDHFIYGWVFFGVVIFALFALGNLFSDVDDSDSGAPAATFSASAKAPAGSPLPVLMVLAAVLWSAGMLQYQLLSNDAASDHQMPGFSGWQIIDAVPAALGGRFEGAAELDERVLADSSGARVQLLRAAYPPRTRDGERVNFNGHVFDDENWRLISGERAVATGLENVPQVQSRHIRRGRDERLLWWWYQLGEDSAVTRVAVKRLEAFQRLSGSYTGMTVVVVSADVGAAGEISGARDRLRSFAGSLLP